MRAPGAAAGMRGEDGNSSGGSLWEEAEQAFFDAESRNSSSDGNQGGSPRGTGNMSWLQGSSGQLSG